MVYEKLSSYATGAWFERMNKPLILFNVAELSTNIISRNFGKISAQPIRLILIHAQLFIHAPMEFESQHVHIIDVRGCGEILPKCCSSHLLFYSGRQRNPLSCSLNFLFFCHRLSRRRVFLSITLKFK